MKAHILRLLFRLVLFSIPFGMIILTYFALDPFRVMYSYDDYYENCYVPINRDFVSTEILLSNYKEQNYNSFIFGSSRTLAYKTDQWLSYLPDGSMPFVYEASEERITGIASKLELLDSIGVSIDNVLIVLGQDVSFMDNSQSLTPHHLIRKHPIVTDKSYFDFQKEYFLKYVSKGFFIRFIDYHFFHTYRSYMTGFIQPQFFDVDSITNDRYMYVENVITSDSAKYYSDNASEFLMDRFTNNPFYHTDRPITPNYISSMKKIKYILDAHQASYKIVISPLYSKISMSEDNINQLEALFGQELVFDFSGVNFITSDKHNYLENSHYRYSVGDTIMNIIYTE